MKLLLLAIKGAPVITTLALLSALCSGLFSGGLIALIHRAIDKQDMASTQLGLQFLGLAGLTLLSAIAANIIIAYLYRKILLNLQVQLAQQIIYASLQQLEQIGSAPLLVVLTEDVENISDIATEIVPLIINAATAIVCFVYLIWLSWQTFLGTMIFLLIGGLSYQLLIRREQKILTLSREQTDDLYQCFRDLTSGIKELKLNQPRAQAFLEQSLRTTARSLQKSLFIWDIAFAIISAWGRFLILTVVGFVLFLLPRFFAIEPGILTGYVLALLYVRSSLMSIIDMLPELSEGTVALNKIESVGLSLTKSEAIGFSSIGNLTTWKTLKLSNISHKYYREQDDSIFHLGPVQITFQRGELVFLIGGNGSGKTTLAKLIAGLYVPEAGNIYLDEEKINNCNRSRYSQIFSAIFSDFYLFDNVLGTTSQDLDYQAVKYLKKLHLHSKVKVQNGRFSTTALSLGQQQRLALLVAYLEDRPFYIFDEWASNQDPIFKNIFYTQFLPELKSRGKTILAISHDDHYFHLGDRVLKLVDGQLIN